MALPQAPAEPFDLHPRHVIIALVLTLALAAFSLWNWYVPDYGAGVDESCYLLTARNLATHADPTLQSPDPAVFMPEYMLEVHPGQFVAKYPIGYPLLCAIAYRLTGWLLGPAGAWQGPFFVNPLLTLIAVLEVYALARLFLSRLFSLAATFTFAIHPMVLYYGAGAMSHTADLTCSLACLLSAFAWYRRPRLISAAATGLFLGGAICIRYTETLLLAPLLYLPLLHLFRIKKAAPAPRKYLTTTFQMSAATLALTLALTPILWFQYRAFGSIFTTGYSFTGESHAFSLANFLAHFPAAILDLNEPPFGLLILFPLACIALPFYLRKDAPGAIFLTLASFPLILLYISYYWITDQAVLYVRFFLAAYPLLIIAALTLSERLSKNWQRIAITATAVFLASFMLFDAPDRRMLGDLNRRDLLAVDLAQRNLPFDGVLLTDDYYAYSLIYRTHFTLINQAYFLKSWDQLHLRPATTTRPADLNPLRIQHLAELVDHLDQPELDQLLQQRLLNYARQNRPVSLLTSASASQWTQRLAPSFTLTPVDQAPTFSNEEPLTLYRLSLSPPNPG